MSNYLVIGSGAREHAIAWKLATESHHTVFVAPGNPGIASDPAIAGCPNIQPHDFPAIKAFVEKEQILSVIVGPEAPLAMGIVDFLSQHDIPTFGPTSDGAQLETSKLFAKQILQEAGIKTAPFQLFDNHHQALQYLQSAHHPLVVKVDGLAAGKGVFVCHNLQDSTAAIDSIFQQNRFGSSGKKILIEHFLSGRECSFICITDGKTVAPLATSRDYKRLLDHDKGPNTGGMGAISPSPDVDNALHHLIVTNILEPLFQTFEKRQFKYLGFLYVGLILTDDGPYVLEFNARLGDPETQALLFGLQHPIADVINATLAHQLQTYDGTKHHSIVATRQLCDHNQPSCTIVLATKDYPNASSKGEVIHGLNDVEGADVKVFFAGVGEENGKLVTNGGRVLCVTATANTPEEAREKAYKAAAKISWEGEQHRSDIGL